MTQVNVTDLRQHLPAYLKRVQAGKEIVVTSHGKIIARIQPEVDKAEGALKRLDSLQGTVIRGDIMSPFDDETWAGDEDNL